MGARTGRGNGVDRVCQWAPADMKMDRYLARSVLLPVALVLALLVVLNCIYLFIDEQGHIGEGTYRMPNALRFIALSVPQQVLDLMPAAVLIGAMLGLGELARRSEIIALRAAGVSVARLALSLGGVGVLLMLLTAFISEYVAPQSTAIARQQRAAARTQREGALQGTRLWIHEGTSYIRIDTERGRHAASGVAVFNVTSDGKRLASAGRAQDVPRIAGNSWKLQQYRQVLYGSDGVRQVVHPVFSLDIKLSAALLDVAVEPSDRSVAGLVTLVRQFHDSRRDARAFIFALWSRVARTVAVLCCVMLALPFAFGGLRSAHSGMRVLLAVGIGIVFVLFQQIVESGAVLSTVDPTLLAWLPTATLAVVTGLLISRIR
ncbi:MAG: LPS export ABC transporter permease LptG [Gammaproteobacteria bacterium]